MREALIKTLGDGIASVWMMNPEEQALELQASAGKTSTHSVAHQSCAGWRSWIGMVAKKRATPADRSTLHNRGKGGQDMGSRGGDDLLCRLPACV